MHRIDLTAQGIKLAIAARCASAARSAMSCQRTSRVADQKESARAPTHKSRAVYGDSDPRTRSHRVRVLAAGRLELLPESPRRAIRAAEQTTAGHVGGLTLTIAVAYGGHDEIADAVRSVLRMAATEGNILAEAIEIVTPEAIGRHLYTAGLPNLDLIIRTSGEIRLSGFLLWQSATASCTSLTSIGRPCARSTSYARSVPFSSVNVVSAAEYWRRGTEILLGVTSGN
jgi:undecaprenyl diphosphate synthase